MNAEFKIGDEVLYSGAMFFEEPAIVITHKGCEPWFIPVFVPSYPKTEFWRASKGQLKHRNDTSH